MEPKLSADERGSFGKFFVRDEYRSLGLDPDFNSMAISTNVSAGTLRGMHFQISPFEEEKLILCLVGRIFDVIVDLRPDSKTVGNWAGIELSGDNLTTVVLPKGVAHGFQTLVPATKVFYALTSTYDQKSARSLNHADPDLGIGWPLPVSKISNKDRNGLSLNEAITANRP